jgi:hypothetical protein
LSIRYVSDFANESPAPGDADGDLTKQFDSCLKPKPPPKAKSAAGADRQSMPAPSDEESERPVWPLFLSGLAFVYLWWLAALFLDLVVVWHYYIRQPGILDRLSEKPSV